MIKRENIIMHLIIIMILVIVIINSGCTTKNASNGTFGEKIISLNNITIINNVTTFNRDYDGSNYFIIKGYLKNNNKYEVYNLKMKATAFDAEGNIVGVNDTPYLNPRVLFVNSDTYFGFTFVDNDHRIVRYDLKIISASAEP